LGKEPWYPFDRRLGGTHSWSGEGGEEKNFCQELNLGHSNLYIT